jgi:penicillin-binding protein 1C
MTIRWLRRPHPKLRRWTLRIAGAGVLGFLAFWWLVPVVQFDDPLSTVILDRDGELLGATIAADGQWRFGVAEEVPEKFVAAITRYEDKRFFRHPGVDPLAMARALRQNFREGEVVSGGSTLTMQVVRLARKNPPRTYRGKLIEAILAVRLEMSLSKRQILGLYAAYAPFGGNTVGLDAAAWRYFGREPGRLSWAETAMLAVLPNAPALIHPGRNRDLLLAKRNRLLDVLRQDGVIDAMTCALAKQEPLPPAPHPLPQLAPHLLDRVRASQRPGRWRTGDASPWVRTTLEKEVQARATEILARHRRALAENGVYNAAALILEVETGRTVAYLGNFIASEPGDHGQHVDVIPARRSTGSVLKPLLFAAMLEAGEVLPGQLVPDVPSHFGAFHPENFDRAYAGAVPAELALARSLNVPAVRMLRSYGVDRFYALLTRLGMTTLGRPAQDYGLSLILGGAEGSLWDVTAIYAGLARTVHPAAPGAPPGGRFFAATYLMTPDASGRRAASDPPLRAASAYLTLKAMLEVERPGEELAWRTYQASQRIAWKTGTSFGFRDAWAVGVTPRYAVGVWVGNADGEGRPGLTGHSAAAPILFELFGLLPAAEAFVEPVHELVDIDVCAQSGMRRGPHCPRSRPQLVPRAGLGAPPCSYCRLVHTDRDGRWQVHGDCEPVASIRTASWFVLPPAMEVHYRRRHSDYRPPPAFRADCRDALADPAGPALSLVYPKEGAQVYVPVEMNGGVGRVVFEAAHRDPQSRIYWHLDDEYYGETREIHQVAVAPAPGPHLLTLVDENGEMVRRRFTVLGRPVAAK